MNVDDVRYVEELTTTPRGRHGPSQRMMKRSSRISLVARLASLLSEFEKKRARFPAGGNSIVSEQRIVIRNDTPSFRRPRERNDEAVIWVVALDPGDVDITKVSGDRHQSADVLRNVVGGCSARDERARDFLDQSVASHELKVTIESSREHFFRRRSRGSEHLR